MSSSIESNRRRDKGKGRAIPDRETINTHLMTQAAHYLIDEEASSSQPLRHPTPTSSSAVNEVDYYTDFSSQGASQSTSTFLGESANVERDRPKKNVQSWIWSLMEDTKDGKAKCTICK